MTLGAGKRKKGPRKPVRGLGYLPEVVKVRKPMKATRKDARPGNSPPTAAESARIGRIKRMGCLACLQLGHQWDEEKDVPQPDAHHLLSGGIRIGHHATIGLCKWHHSARLVVDGWGALTHLFQLGPSLLQHPARFKEQFGDDDSLLEMQEEVLAGRWAA